MKIAQLSETIWADLKFAARGLRKSPGFLAVVVLSLGLGIAANSTIFSVLNALLLSPPSLSSTRKSRSNLADRTGAPGVAATAAHRGKCGLEKTESRLR